MSPSKFVIVAPAWRQEGHVGNYRIDRFIRWLSEYNHEVVVVRGGEDDSCAIMPWGREITIRDPLGLHRESSHSPAPPVRQPNRLRRGLAYWMFNPDPAIVWGRRAVTHPIVLRLAQGAQWVISSSPPESAHVAAALLARRLDAALLVDLRDGWLDEPLRPLLRSSGMRRWREGRLETRILRQARRILVTSAEWQEMLQARLAFTQGKTVVLTNAYPLGMVKPGEPALADGRLTLLHSGRLSGSSASRRAPLLLAPLLAGLGLKAAPTGTLLFLGNLSREDREDLARHEWSFEQRGWRIATQAAVARGEMLERLSAAHGLLLLSASQAAIPSKIFEYIPAGKPVLAACPEGSAVWRMVRELPQFFLIDYRCPERAAIRRFLHACQTGRTRFEVPERYSEPYLKDIFLAQVLA